MAEFPAVNEAWLSGELSGGHIQAIVADTCERTAERFASQEAALIPGVLEREEPSEPQRSLYCSKTLSSGALDLPGWKLRLEPDGVLHIEPSNGCGRNGAQR